MGSITGPSGIDRFISAPVEPEVQTIQQAIAKTPIEDAVKVSLSQNTFFGDVEKHIDDYKKGRGYLSKETAGILGQRDTDTASALAYSNVRASKLYTGYSTTFGYDKHARFVEGLSFSIQSTLKISSIYKK